MNTPDFDSQPRRRPVAARDEDVDESGGPGVAAEGLASTLGNERVGQVLRRATDGGDLDESVAREIEDRRGGGRSLSDDVQADMEDGFGHDFSDVRVHTDAAADDLNARVNARAFTVGNDVFFQSGAYDPGSTSGRELLAHELTHVVQQEGAGDGAPTTVSDPSDASERQADAVAQEVVSGTGSGSDGAGGVARQAIPEEEEELQATRQPEEEEEELQMARQPEEEEEELQMARQPEEEEEELQAARQPAREDEELQMARRALRKRG